MKTSQFNYYKITQSWRQFKFFPDFENKMSYLDDIPNF